jgi:Arf/Sar family protein
MCGELQIYVVDSMDRERIGVAKEEFQAIIRDPLMLNSVILLLANKQDLVIAKSLTNQ